MQKLLAKVPGITRSKVVLISDIHTTSQDLISNTHPTPKPASFSLGTLYWGVTRWSGNCSYSCPNVSTNRMFSPIIAQTKANTPTDYTGVLEYWSTVHILSTNMVGGTWFWISKQPMSPIRHGLKPSSEQVAPSKRYTCSLHPKKIPLPSSLFSLLFPLAIFPVPFIFF